VIAVRFAGAWWAAGALVIATCAALVVRSPTAQPHGDDRAWYLAEIRDFGDRYAETQRELDGIDRQLLDLERDEGDRPAAEVERDAERLLAAQERLHDERYRMVTHCGPRVSLDESISRLDAEHRAIAARLGELERTPATHQVERVRLRRQLRRVAATREGLRRLQQTHDPLAL
jgi:chromosome segregation ATPase